MRRLASVCVAATCAAALVFAAAGGAVPGDHGKAAIAKACAAEKKAGKAEFRAKYGKHAMRNCIKGITAESTVAPTTAPTELNPAQTCAEQQASDPAGFAATYGNNHANPNSNGVQKNAYGQCVAQAAQASHGPPA